MLLPEAVVTAVAPVWRQDIDDFQKQLKTLQDDIIRVRRDDPMQRGLGGMDQELEARTREQVRQTLINDLQEAYISDQLGWKGWIPVYGHAKEGQLYAQMGESGKANMHYALAAVDVVLTVTDAKAIHSVAKALLERSAARAAAKAAAKSTIEHSGVNLERIGAKTADVSEYGEHQKVWGNGEATALRVNLGSRTCS